MLHTRLRLLMLLITSLVFVLLPAASALAGGRGPAEPNTNFTMQGLQREHEKGCFANDVSPLREFVAHVLITHEEGKTLQVTAMVETVEGEEVAYLGETYVKSEEEYVGITMHAITAEIPEVISGAPFIGPWAFGSSFNFYENGYKVGVGKGDEQFELCGEEGTENPTIKGVITKKVASGSSTLINVLEQASDPGSKELEVVAVSQPKSERGWSIDPHNGRVFIEHNQVRYTAPSQTKNYQVSFAYFISNGKEGWAEGFVIVEVFEGSESPPKPPIVVVPPVSYGPVVYVPTVPIKGGGPSEVFKPVPLKGGAPYDLTLSRKAHISHGVVSVILTCREHIECSGLLNLILGNRIVGAYRYSVGYGSWVIKIKLTKAAARSLRKDKGRKLSLVASATCCRKLTVVLEH